MFAKLRLVLMLGAVLGFAWAAQAASPEPIRIGQTTLTNGLDPTRGSNGFALVTHGVGEKLFTVDRSGTLVPQLATSAVRQSETVWLVNLRPGRSFSDGSPVDAPAVAASLAATAAVNPAARASGGQLQFDAVDDRTVRVRTERPVPMMQALLAEWAMIVYRLRPDGTAVFSGPYEIVGFRQDASINLRPNPYYPGADRRTSVEIRKFNDPQAMALAFEAGQLDLAFGLPSQIAGRLKATPGLIVKSFQVGYQYLGLINTTRPIAQDTRVRRAIDLAIDRETLVMAINGGLPATGLYAPYFPFAAKTARPTDLAAARALLEDAGWKVGSSGVREKNGQPLRLVGLAFPQRPDLMIILPVIKAQLKVIGIDLETRIVENALQAAAAGDFDILLWNQHTAPSADPAFILGVMFRSDGGSNHMRFKNAALDGLIDHLGREADSEKRTALALQVQERIFAEAPAIFLVSPSWFVGLSPRLARYEPWGSDYHIVRDDLGE